MPIVWRAGNGELRIGKGLRKWRQDMPTSKIPCMFFDVSECSWTKIELEKVKCTLGLLTAHCDTCENYIVMETDPEKVALLNQLVKDTQGLLDKGWLPNEILKITFTKLQRNKNK